MPRARNIKPSFFKDAKIVACAFESRLLFQGLWCLADYKGRLKYVPLEIKMEVFPGDNVDVETCIEELAEKGLIEIYHDHSGTALVQVRNFCLHQNPHVNEKQDKNKKPLPCLPSPEECKNPEEEKDAGKSDIKQLVKDALRVLREYSESDPADSLLLIPDSLLLFPEKNNPADAEYAFEGENVRVNQADYKKHKDRYTNIDVMDYYHRIDDELKGKAKSQRWAALVSKLEYHNKKPSQSTKPMSTDLSKQNYVTGDL